MGAATVTLAAIRAFDPQAKKGVAGRAAKKQRAWLFNSACARRWGNFAASCAHTTQLAHLVLRVELMAVPYLEPLEKVVESEACFEIIPGLRINKQSASGTDSNA